MKLFGINIGRTRLAAPNPFQTPDVNASLPRHSEATAGPEGKVLMPFVEKQPPIEQPPQRQAIYLNPRWEPINISANTTAQGVQTAIREAENGETRELFRYYRDVLLGDDHVQFCVNARKTSILSMPISVLPVDKNNAADVVAAAACKRMIADCENWNTGMSFLMSSCFWPVSIMERLYTPSPAPAPGEPALRWTLRKFEPVNPMLLCYRWAYLTGGIAMGSASPIQQAGLGLTPGNFMIDLEVWEPYLKLWPTDNSGRIIYDSASAQFLDRTRHIVHRGHLLTEHRDNWGGPARADLGWWLLRQLGRDWWGQFMQTYGKPFLTGKTNVEDEQAINFLKDAFKMAQRVGGIVIGHEDQIELTEAMVAGGAEGHEKWLTFCNKAIARHICGQDLESQGHGLDGGAQAELKGTVRDDVRKLDQILLAETVEKQIFRPALDLNGLPGRCKCVWGGLSAKDAADTGALLVQLKQSQLQPTDEAIEVISERVGFSVERCEMPDGNSTGGSGGSREQTNNAEQLSANLNLRDLSSRSGNSLLALRSPVQSPIQPFIDAKSPALAAAFRGSRAPILALIEASSSAEDLEQKLTAHYRDWNSQRITGIVEEALQLAAATGAANAGRDASPRRPTE